ncbi:MAG: hypothetical protein AAGF91_10735 [Actinomycetota bacterium]
MRRLGALVCLIVLVGCGGGDGVSTEISDDSAEVSDDTAPVSTTSEVEAAEAEPSATQSTATDPTGTDPPPTDPSGGLDTRGLAERIRLSDASFEYEDGFAFFEGCVADDHVSVLTGLFGGLIPPGIEASFLDPDVTFGSSLRLRSNGISLIGCTAAPDLDGVGFDVATAPPSVESYAREFNLPDGPIDGVELTVEEIGSESGGTLHTVVLTDVNDPDLQSGEIAWIDDHVMVTAYGFGPDLSAIDLDVLRVRFVDQLPTIVDTALR